jgi:hypothetical protein
MPFSKKNTLPMIKFLLIAALSVWSMIANAQLEKTIHQTFSVDEAHALSIDLASDFEVILWSGDHILSETNIQLYDASEGIFEHFLKEGRYDILADSASQQLNLHSRDMERKPIRTKKTECFEQVKVRLFVPDTFAVLDKHNLSRK